MKEEKEEGWKRIETANGLLTDPGPTYSVLNTNQGKLNQETINVVGATGKLEKEIFFNPINFKFSKQWITRQFLCMPDCLVLRLGRDLYIGGSDCT